MQTPSGGATRLSFRKISKTFDGVPALNEVSFDVESGCIHALLGANGAGKSTLIRILAGFYKPDSGEILIDGSPQASAPDVAFIHQDLALIPEFTVAENIALVAGYPRKAGAISWADVNAQAQDALDQVGGGIDVDAKISDLSRADQSLVAIARALSVASGAIVLDEPTASLPEADVERLFVILERLRARGVSVLYVSHRLDEIRRIADRLTILRDGAVIVDGSMSEITDEEIVTAIAGGAVQRHHAVAAGHHEEELLAISHARINPDGGTFSMNIMSGEVLGLAGLRGAGHAEVGRAIAGIDPMHESRFSLRGAPIDLGSVRRAMKRGIGFATSRREQEGLAMTLTARENFFLNPSALKRGMRGFLLTTEERKRAAALGASIRLKPADPEAVVATFSGGNQQKVVLGRWLSIDLVILVLEEPTMGIDVGARAEIYTLIQSLAEQGLSLLVVSSDFEELATVCSRVLVFDRGVIRVELRGEEISVESITHHASAASRKVVETS